jgi:hypothetical protein
MLMAVICSDGFTYEKSAIEQWLQSHDSSPMTGIELSDTKLVPNRVLKTQVHRGLSPRLVGLTTSSLWH